MDSQKLIDKSKKNNIVSFVRSVTDMEIRVFTLKETAKACLEKASKKEHDSVSEINKRKNALAICERNYKEALNKRNEINSFKKYCKYQRNAGRFIGFLFIHYFLGAFFSILFAGITSGAAFNGNWTSKATIILLLVGITVYLIIFTLIWLKVKTKNYKKLLYDRGLSLLEAEEKIGEAKKAIFDAELELKNQKAANLILYKRANELEASAKEIRENLDRCYALDIVPPSYRKFICLVIINDIFANDKADTMREAILLCDSEIRHGQLINKLDDIYHSLKTLSASIQSMQDVLYSINSNIKNISNYISNMEKNQERIAYAAESIKSSSDNMNFYIQQRRAGAI